MVSSNDASKQNTGGQTSSARVGDWEQFGRLEILHTLSNGLVDLEIVTHFIAWGSVQAVCAFGVLKPC